MCGLCFCLLTFAYAGRASGDPSETGSDPISELALFTQPQGWTKHLSGFGRDSSVFFKNGSCEIWVKPFGGKDSRYATPKEFLAGPEALDDEGKPAAAVEKITVNGNLTPSYMRSYRVPQGAPGVRSADPFFEPFDIRRETMVLVPAEERFFVLKYSFQYSPHMEDAFAAEDAAGLVAWKAFLKSFEVKKAESRLKGTKSNPVD